MKSQLRTSDRHARVTLLALTTAVLILVMAGVLFAGERHAPSVVGAAPGTPTTAMSGWLHVVYGDAPGGGGREAINRRRVTVAGQPLPGPSAAGSAVNSLVAVHSIVPDARQGVPGALQGLSPALQGESDALVSDRPAA
jgi:hypothetical protein